MKCPELYRKLIFGNPSPIGVEDKGEINLMKSPDLHRKVILPTLSTMGIQVEVEGVNVELNVLLNIGRNVQIYTKNMFVIPNWSCCGMETIPSQTIVLEIE